MFKAQMCKKANTKDKNLKINSRNQIDDTIAFGLGEGFLSIHSSFAC